MATTKEKLVKFRGDYEAKVARKVKNCATPMDPNLKAAVAIRLDELDEIIKSIK